jgi:formylglycine-generating enzyme required for sulfatase activity
MRRALQPSAFILTKEIKPMNTRILIRLALATAVITALLITASAQRQARRPSATKPAPADQPARASRPTVTNSIGMVFVEIPAGSFWMGRAAEDCPRDDPFTEKNEYKECMDRNRSSSSEMPRHRVTISKPFWMGKYEVTQEQWYKVMGNNPSDFKSEKGGGDSRNHPVENVSWNDAREFIRRLNRMEGTDVYRLPSEAEWEYACRAGSTGEYSFGDSESLLSQYAWCDSQGGNMTKAVGQKRPNAWGLYDMHGNVEEWCEDDWHDNYNGAPTDGRAWVDGPSRGSIRVLRGGAWSFVADGCKSEYRSSSPPCRVECHRHGFRLLRT